MSHHTAAKLSRSIISQLGTRGFSTASVNTSEIAQTFARLRPAFAIRNLSTSVSPNGSPKDEKNNSINSDKSQNDKIIPSYWGVAPAKLTKEDGSAWKWNCFTVSVFVIVVKFIAKTNYLANFNMLQI